jgi:DNA-binding NtrC family response regulator
LVRSTLVEMLAADGHTADAAPAAGAALEMLDERAYDVILCDIQMPGVDGLEFYAELQKRHPDLCRRVIFITGHGLGARVAGFLEQTAIRYLRKPIPLDRVRGVLEESAKEPS